MSGAIALAGLPTAGAAWAVGGIVDIAPYEGLRKRRADEICLGEHRSRSSGPSRFCFWIVLVSLWFPHRSPCVARRRFNSYNLFRLRGACLSEA